MNNKLTKLNKEKSTIICGNKTAACTCTLKKEHEGPHECHIGICEGSWTYDKEGNFVVVSWPLGDDSPFRFLL